jgi:hypothetical protein
MACHSKARCGLARTRWKHHDAASEESQIANARKINPMFGDLCIQRKEIRDRQKRDEEPDSTEDPQPTG